MLSIRFFPSSVGLFQSTGAGLTRSCEGLRGLRAGALMLQMPEVDGDLQLMPLACQAEALRFEACVDVDKFSPKPTQRGSLLPGEGHGG